MSERVQFLILIYFNLSLLSITINVRTFPNLLFIIHLLI